jgi:Pterin 4 alpha carbinolamine dehydratase
LLFAIGLESSDSGTVPRARVDDDEGPARRVEFDGRRFIKRVGDLAEAEGHHPDIIFGWGYATVSLQTKKIKGLHENDFIIAAKLDQLADSRQTTRGSSPPPKPTESATDLVSADKQLST